MTSVTLNCWLLRWHLRNGSTGSKGQHIHSPSKQTIKIWNAWRHQDSWIPPQTQWALLFDCFCFMLHYWPDPKNTKADSLSRCYASELAEPSQGTILPPSCFLKVLIWERDGNHLLFAMTCPQGLCPGGHFHTTSVTCTIHYLGPRCTRHWTLKHSEHLLAPPHQVLVAQYAQYDLNKYVALSLFSVGKQLWLLLADTLRLLALPKLPRAFHGWTSLQTSVQVFNITSASFSVLRGLSQKSRWPTNMVFEDCISQHFLNVSWVLIYTWLVQSLCKCNYFFFLFFSPTKNCHF